MPVHTTIALGLQGASLLSQLFGESDKDRRRRRLEETLSLINKLREQAVTRGARRLTRETARAGGSARQAAASRAAALGKTSDVESFVLPAEGRVATAGADALERFLESTRERFDRASIEAQLQFQGGPLDPGFAEQFGDVLSTVGRGVGEIGEAERFEELLGRFAPSGNLQAGQLPQAGRPELPRIAPPLALPESTAPGVPRPGTTPVGFGFRQEVPETPFQRQQRKRKESRFRRPF